jgi:hypothetical protein
VAAARSAIESIDQGPEPFSAVRRIDALYTIEREAKSLSAVDRQSVRERQARPVP